MVNTTVCAEAEGNVGIVPKKEGLTDGIDSATVK